MKLTYLCREERPRERNRDYLRLSVDSSFNELLLTELQQAITVLETDSSLTEPTLDDKVRLTRRLCSVQWLGRYDNETCLDLFQDPRFVSVIRKIILDEDIYYVFHEDDGGEAWVDCVACVCAELVSLEYEADPCIRACLLWPSVSLRVI